jgi:hypothetical protein
MFNNKKNNMSCIDLSSGLVSQDSFQTNINVQNNATINSLITCNTNASQQQGLYQELIHSRSTPMSYSTTDSQNIFVRLGESIGRDALFDDLKGDPIVSVSGINSSLLTFLVGGTFKVSIFVELTPPEISPQNDNLYICLSPNDAEQGFPTFESSKLLTLYGPSSLTTSGTMDIIITASAGDVYQLYSANRLNENYSVLINTITLVISSV